MNLIRYNNPKFNALDNFDRFFEHAFDNLGLRPTFDKLLEEERGVKRPAVDLFEDENSYIARFELPGVEKSDVRVELEDGYLVVSGERREKTKEEERSISFHRSVAVPDSVNVESVNAKFENGLLTITLPKSEERKPRQIEIS